MQAPGDSPAPRVRSVAVLRDFAVMLAVAAAYYGGARFGLSLALGPSTASAVWPPTGIALAALLVLGMRYWPAVFVGALVAEHGSLDHLPASILIAGGNTLEAVAGAFAVRAWANGVHAFARPRDVFRFIALAGILTPVVAASVGAAALVVFGLAPADAASDVWLTWWLGDAAGAIVLAPVLILLATPPPADRLPPRRAEASAAIVTTLLVGFAVWGPWSDLLFAGRPYAFVTTPFLLWVALRLGSRMTALAVLALDSIALWGTLAGRGPFILDDPAESLLYLQGFLATATLLTLPTAALAHQQAVAQAGLRRLADRLELDVQERTRELQQQADRLRESEQALRHSVRRTDDAERATRRGTWEWDVATNKALWSRGMYELFGVDPATFVNSNENFLALVHPDDRERMTKALTDALARPGRFDQEYRLLRPDGQVRHIRGEGDVVTSAGKPTMLHGVVADVTDLKAVEEARAQAEARLRAVLDNASDAIVTGDAAGTIVGWNRAAQRIFGRSEAEALGAPIASLLTPEQWAKYQQDIAAYQQGQPTRYVGHPREMKAVRRDGTAIDVEMSLAAWTSSAGPMVTGVVRDITERKQAERAAQRAQERFARVFAGSPLAISLSSVEGRLLDVNPAFAALSGYDAGELLAPSFKASALYAEPAQRDLLVQDLRSKGKVTAREFHLLRKDGARRAVLGSLEFLDVGDSRTILGMFQDVTALNDARAEREARLASEAEMERLRRADRFRVDFINSTAHELKTPLTPLVLAVSTLGADKGLGDAARRSVDAIRRSVDRLRRLVDDLLGAADLQARTLALDKRRLNLTRELRAAVAANLPAAERAAVALEEGEDAGLSVTADPARLQLVLGHLIGNAIKFTPSGGRVTVAARREGEDVRVSVTDTGIGLAPADIEALWKPFGQVHDKSQRTDSGHGLGLYVAKGIVDLHGGEVGCSSPGKGKGSTFWFTLPLAVGHVDPLAKAKAEPVDTGPRRNLNPTVKDD